MSKPLLREALAEFLGTFVLIVFGVAVNAQVTLGEGRFGDFLSINLGWGLAVTMGVYACAGVSGGHLNPAVTLALAARGRIAWSKVPVYWIAQVLGAVLASAVVFFVYHEALEAYARHHSASAFDVPGVKDVTHPTAQIWATYPRVFADGSVLSNFPGGLLDQIVATGLLVLVVFALSDPRNAPPLANLAPMVVGGTVLLIGMTFGFNCGYAINPARDFGPRLFTFLGGWGTDVFTVYNHFWWVPIAGPLAGGVMGAFAYDYLIALRHPREQIATAASAKVSIEVTKTEVDH